jgi:hypothetical protein
MTRDEFLDRFKKTLSKIVSRPGVSKKAKDDLAEIDKNSQRMVDLARPLLAEVQPFAQPTVFCRYDIDGTTFCDSFPEELCDSVEGTSDTSSTFCDGFPNGWSQIFTG